MCLQRTDTARVTQTGQLGGAEEGGVLRVESAGACESGVPLFDVGMCRSMVCVEQCRVGKCVSGSVRCHVNMNRDVYQYSTLCRDGCV